MYDSHRVYIDVSLFQISSSLSFVVLTSFGLFVGQPPVVVYSDFP